MHSICPLGAYGRAGILAQGIYPTKIWTIKNPNYPISQIKR